MQQKNAEQWCLSETASLLNEIGGSPEVVRKVVIDASDVSTVRLGKVDSEAEIKITLSVGN